MIKLDLLNDYTNICIVSGVLNNHYYAQKKQIFLKLKTSYDTILQCKLPRSFETKLPNYLGKKVIVFGSITKIKSFSKELNRYIPEIAIRIKNMEIIYDL